MHKKLSFVLTRPDPANSNLAAKLISLGYNVSQVPLIVSSEIILTEGELTSLRRLSDADFEWLVVVSPTAAEFLKKRITEIPDSIQLVAQGQATAQKLIALYGERKILLPNQPTALSIYELWEDAPVERVLLVAAKGGRPELSERLKASGCQVTRLELYQTIALKLDQPSHRILSQADALVFFSPSAVKAAYQALEAALFSKVLFSVGPTTSAEIEAVAHCAKVDSIKLFQAQTADDSGIITQVKAVNWAELQLNVDN